MTTPQPNRPTGKPSGFSAWMGSMWLYTLLRFALFFALWGIFYLVGLHGLIAAIVALVVSVPLSFVLLARPRARFTAQIEARMNERTHERKDFDARLQGDERRDG